MSVSSLLAGVPAAMWPSNLANSEGSSSLQASKSVQYSTVIVGGDPNPRRKPASLGLMRVPEGMIRTPVSQVRYVGDRNHHQASRRFQYPITPGVGDPCWNQDTQERDF